MKKLIFITLCATLLMGCTPSATVKSYPVMPDELKDCKFFLLIDDIGAHIVVARCPNSTTTVKNNNKAGTTSVIVDGKK